MTRLPLFFRVRQTFEDVRLDDVEGEVARQLSRLRLDTRIAPGQSVAVTAGSRGIANIARILRAAVAHLRSIGAKPFIVPAMGSHGGGTADGQRGVLEGYGITEQFVGCPIRATMETVVVCRTSEGIPVHFDRYAYEADHVLVAGRVKPHTNFVGEIESGLMKMMLIGLGKHEGAKIYHRAIQDYSFGQIIRSVAGEVLANCRIAAGLAIVENGYDQTALIEAVPPHDFVSREKELLILAKRWLPRLPFDRADVVVVDEMGKDISGAGMDPNIFGRKAEQGIDGAKSQATVRRIVVRGLSHATHGNATGIGRADFCTTRLLRQMDRRSTQINCITGGSPDGAKIPIDFETDREMLETALTTVGLVEPENARVAWIHNTLDLVEVECSRAYLAEAETRSDLQILTPPRTLAFDEHGNLESAWQAHQLQAAALH